MQADMLFSADYATARDKFRAACTLRGLEPQAFVHPLAGAQGEPLATDVVHVGPADARRVLVLTSGVHGVELFAGAGCQIDWLLTHGASDLPRDTAAGSPQQLHEAVRSELALWQPIIRESGFQID